MIKWLVLALLAGCTSREQTVQQGWSLICDAPVRCCSNIEDPMERATKTAAWIMKHVTNPEARHDFDALGSVAGDKGPLIRERLAELGMAKRACPILN